MPAMQLLYAHRPGILPAGHAAAAGSAHGTDGDGQRADPDRPVLDCAPDDGGAAITGYIEVSTDVHPGATWRPTPDPPPPALPLNRAERVLANQCQPSTRGRGLVVAKDDETGFHPPVRLDQAARRISNGTGRWTGNGRGSTIPMATTQVSLSGRFPPS